MIYVFPFFSPPLYSCAFSIVYHCGCARLCICFPVLRTTYRIGHCSRIFFDWFCVLVWGFITITRFDSRCCQSSLGQAQEGRWIIPLSCHTGVDCSVPSQPARSSAMVCLRGSPHQPIGRRPYPVRYSVANPVVRGLLDRKIEEQNVSTNINVGKSTLHNIQHAYHPSSGGSQPYSWSA